MATTYVDEFRGTDNLVYAEVLTDNNEVGEGYTTGQVKILAPVAEISKTTETESDSKYYDNHAALVISSEGADTISLTVSALSLETLADITGKGYDNETGALLDGERTVKYFALGYRLKLVGDKPGYRYVWRYKGTFGVPEENSETENASTDSNNQTLTYTGISTNHKFENATDSNGNTLTQKALVVDQADWMADLSTFFNSVTTCDTLVAVTPTTMRTVTNNLTNVVNSNSATRVADGSGYAAYLTAPEGYTIGSVTVTMGGVDVTSTAYDDGLIAIADVTGNIVITATASE